MTPKLITGTFQFPDGTPAAGATLTLLLSQDSSESGSGQILHVPILITLDANGAIPANTAIFANDQITPNGTYYVVSVKDKVYGLVYFEQLAIQGTSPISLNALVPKAKNAPPPSNIQGMVRVRVQHTVTTPDVNAGNVAIPITFPVPFADTNYTVDFNTVLISGIDPELIYAASISNKTAAGCTANVAPGATAGDVFEVNLFAMHD